MNMQKAGYLEVIHYLALPLVWSQRQLLEAARASQLRNTGWPIGIVLDRHDLAPKVTEEGIEVRVGGLDEDEYDYWTLTIDGKFYFIRAFEEDLRDKKNENRNIFWDVRLWRIAESLLHSAVLYRTLGVPPDSSYVIQINHLGLNSREFLVSEPFKYATYPGNICSADTSSWSKRVNQNIVNSSLKNLVNEISDKLFVLFNFQKVPQTTVDSIVDKFLNSRL